jgi:nicotinate-nucleotide adenylyltransferase
MEVPALAISSTDIRERMASRRPVRYLLPEAVATYAEKNALYRGGL